MTTDLRQRIADLSPETRRQLESQLLNNLPRAKQNTIARQGSSVYPLSVGQERLFFLHLLEPESPAYNQPKALRITGHLDPEVMRKALVAVVARHEVLHSTFVLQDGIPAQIPSKDYLLLELPLFDLSRRPSEWRLGEARKLIAEIGQRPFDLSADLMLRTALFRLTPTDHILLLVTHHIVSDGRSRDILFHEIAALYAAFSAHKPSPLPALPIQFGDFALWQRDSLEQAALEEQFSYWRRQLKDVPTLLKLPTDRPRAASQTFWGSDETIVISRPTTEKLRDLSRRHSATLFMTLLAAFQVLLSRYTGEPVFLIGVPISGRRLRQLENLIGFFVSSLLLKADVSGDPTFPDLLTQVRETALQAYAHPDIPFESLLRELQPERDLSFHPMFQVMFALRSDFTKPIALDGMTFTPMPVEIGTAKFDLTLSVTERADDMAATFVYNSDLFDGATIRRMATGFSALLEEIVFDPDRSVGKLSLLTKKDREEELLLGSGRARSKNPMCRCVHELFEERAALTPDATAVMVEENRLSYRELDGKANQLARHLKSLGVGPGVLAGIYMERSLDMVVALLAVLKTGAAYVPLDLNDPKERLSLILEDTELAVVLSRQRLAAMLPECRAKVVCLDSDWATVARQSPEIPIARITHDSLAYVIYTSGSTKKPKGVEITHGALANFVRSAGDMFALEPNDRVLQFASISFDTAVEEIFPCLVRGATLVLRTDSMLDSVSRFLQQCRVWAITVVDLPTVYWHELTEILCSERLALPEQLRLVIIGGESAAPQRVAQWRTVIGDRVRLLNTYGPTETTVVATAWEPAQCAGEGSSLREVPIGRSISGVETYVLDRYLEPVPRGVLGELCVGGMGLARGYLNRPDLTAERFIPNPFSDQPGARLYRTGDLARYLPDGNIEFLGRFDHQVKIRGFRIELGEVEAAVTRHPAVREAVVVAEDRRPRTDDGGQTAGSKREASNPSPSPVSGLPASSSKRLVAYVVPKHGLALTVSELRSFLMGKLPEHMVPSAFVLLDALPLAPNGKVDRKALPAPDQSRPEQEAPFVPPSTWEQKKIAEIWAEVLKVERVGIYDNFFELGGHSLLATQVLSRLREAFRIEVPLRALFETPTIAGLAVQILQPETKTVVPEDMADVLADLESLSDEEAERLLARERSRV